MTLIESEQSKDTQLTQIARGPFSLRFASYRKGEDAKLDLRSEDYIVSELTPERAIFGLCDGVGSSYYGNIGSQFLGETLLNWLGNLSSNRASDIRDKNVNLWSEQLANDLKEELDSKINLATSIIQNRKTTSQGELIQLAEKTQRDDFGTQSNLVGGIIWPKSKDFPEGFVLLFWLGNARIRIFNKLDDNKYEELTHLTKWGNNPEQLKEVWSSKEGVVGRVYSYKTDLSKISTIIAYSDGLEGVEENITPNIQGINLETLIRRAQSIKDDDVSYLEISLTGERINDYSDDIVAIIRGQYSAPANSFTSESESEAESELKELERKYENLEKKINNKTLAFKKTKRQFMFLAAILILSAISMGLLLGYSIGSQKVVEIIPTPTNLSTITPSLPTNTPLVVTALATISINGNPFGSPATNETTTQVTPITPDLSLTSIALSSTPNASSP